MAPEHPGATVEPVARAVRATPRRGSQRPQPGTDAALRAGEDERTGQRCMDPVIVRIVLGRRRAAGAALVAPTGARWRAHRAKKRGCDKNWHHGMPPHLRVGERHSHEQGRLDALRTVKTAGMGVAIRCARDHPSPTDATQNAMWYGLSIPCGAYLYRNVILSQCYTICSRPVNSSSSRAHLHRWRGCQRGGNQEEDGVEGGGVITPGLRSLQGPGE